MYRLSGARRFVPRLVGALISLTWTACLGAWGQGSEPLLAKLDRSGMITVLRGGTELGYVELNAHGPNWQHAPQSTATATVSPLPGGGGLRFEGTLPIPNTEGGALRFVQAVSPAPQGLALVYDVVVLKAMKLNGLQLSLEVPTSLYADKEVLISQPGGQPDSVTLPREAAGYVWSGAASRFEVSRGTPNVLGLELRAAADALIQDLRNWKHDLFELRFPALNEDQGRDMTVEDRFHLEVTVLLAGPAKLVGP